MFEVTTLKECPITGITTYEMKWSLGRGIQTDHGNFMNLEDARQYISSSKRSYILIMFDNFVHRARCHFEIGDSEYYQKESKLASLERCTKYTQWFEGKELQTIVKVIMALEDDLRRILPKPSEKSFSGLESAIIDMIIFCKRELGNTHPMPALKSIK